MVAIFTGIVEELGKVREIRRGNQSCQIEIGARRVLADGGRLGLWDIVAGGGGQLDYPLPWADRSDRSHLVTSAQLRTTVCPTMLQAGLKINVIPNAAEAQLDIRRLPGETRAEVMARLRRMVRDKSIEISAAPGQEMPATGSSPPVRVMSTETPPLARTIRVEPAGTANAGPLAGVGSPGRRPGSSTGARPV